MRQSDYLEENFELVRKLKELPVFSSFHDRHINGLIKLCKIREYEPKEIVFEEGTFDNHIYFLLSGKVNIVKQGMVVCTLRRTGDLFGEMGIIDGKPRSASVHISDRTSCLMMDASFIDRLPENEKEVCLYILYRVFSDILSSRLRSTTEELIKAKAEIERIINAAP